MEQIQTKKIMWVGGIIVVIALVIFGINYWQSKSEQAQVNAHPCVANILATYVFNVPTSTSPTEIGHTLLSQLLDQYKGMTNCDTIGIKDYKIDSVGTATFVEKDFTIPSVFDVEPISKSQTEWATSSASWQGDWVRGYAFRLGIQNTSTTTSQSFRLVLQ